VTDINQWVHELVPNAHFNRGRTRNAEAVLNEAVRVPLPELHLRNASLALLYRWKPKQKAGERGTIMIIEAVLCSESIGELVIAAVLEKPPHRPDEFPIARAEFQAMAPRLPTQRIAAFGNGVPCVHGSRGVGVTHARVALHVKPGRTPCGRSAESDPLDSELRHNVIPVCVLIIAAHRKSRHGDCGRIHQMRAKDLVPGNRTLVREVIVKSAEAGKIDRHESVLGAGGVTSGKAVAVREDVVQ